MRDATARRRAVTLLELLVTVAATVVLTTILVITIRGVRGQSLTAMNINNLRMSAQDFYAWSVENDSKLLNLESPQSALYTRTHRDLPNPPTQLFQGLSWGLSINWQEYFAVHYGRRSEHWTTAFRQTVADDPSIPAQAGRIVEPSFFYSPTMFTSSSLWTDPPPSNSLAGAANFFRTLRLTDIAHPSRKGLLVHLNVPVSNEMHHVAFVDGHAAGHTTVELTPPVQSPTSPTGAPGRPILHTQSGHEGVDL